MLAPLPMDAKAALSPPVEPGPAGPTGGAPGSLPSAAVEISMAPTHRPRGGRRAGRSLEHP